MSIGDGVLFGGGAGDGDEFVGFEAGSADEGAVDILLGEEFGGIGGGYGAAVQDADGLGGFGAKQVLQGGADYVTVNGLGVFCGGGAPGADGPDGFVGDDDVGGKSGIDIFEAFEGLAANDLGGLPGFVFGEGFSNAYDGDEADFLGGDYFFVDGGVGFAEVGAPFRVADDDVFAEFFDHAGGCFAGIGAFFFPVHVLRAEAEVCAADEVGYGDEGHEGWAEDFFHAFDVLEFFAHD